MKTIKLPNSSIVRVFNFLNEVSLKNKASRGKTKFMKKLEEKDKEFQEAKKEIQKEYFKEGEGGEFETDGNQLVYKDDVTEEQKEEIANRVIELLDEEFEISFTEYSGKYEALFEALDNLDKELSGENALAYDELLDAYEENEGRED